MCCSPTESLEVCFELHMVDFVDGRIMNRCSINDGEMIEVRSPSVTDDFVFFSNSLLSRCERSSSIESDTSECCVREHPFKAVDNDSSTCWYSAQAVRHGEYFGIDLLQVRTNITLELILAHAVEFQKSLVMSLSLDKKWWMPYRSTNGIHFHDVSDSQLRDKYKMVLDASEFNLGFRSFRYIAFNRSSDSLAYFHVCNVQLFV